MRESRVKTTTSMINTMVLIILDKNHCTRTCLNPLRCTSLLRYILFLPVSSYLKSPLYRSPGFATTLVANLGAVFGVIYFTLLEQPALISYPTAALMGLGTVSSGLTMLSSLL